MGRMHVLSLAVVLLATGLGGVLFLLRDPGPGDAGRDGAEVPHREAGSPGEAVPPAILQGAPGAGASAGGQDPTPPSEADLAPGDVLVRGRLVAPDGTPARDGTVAIVQGETVLGSRAAAKDGSFALLVRAGAFDASAETGVRAADGAGHHAAQQVWLGRRGPRNDASPEPGRVVDVGVVRLVPVHGLEVEVRFPSGTKPPALVRASVVGMGRSPALASTHPTDAEGRLRLQLPEGTSRLLAVAEGCGREVAWVTLPREEPGPLVILLPPERPVTVEVVDGASGAPVPGAEVAATEIVQAPGASYVTSAAWWPTPEPSRTDADGRLVLRGLGPQQGLSVVANAEGYPRAAGYPPRFQSARVEAGATSVRIEMVPPRTVRWPLEAGTDPRPPEGAAIRVRPAPGTYLADEQIPPEGRIESGELVVPGWPPGPLYGHAVAPDGSIASLFAKDGEDVGMPTRFYPSRRIEVRVRYPDGEGAAGWYVNVRNQGNNPLAPPAPTGPDGRAVLEGLYGGPHGLVEVHVSDRNEAWSGTPGGTLDLAKGDGSLEVTVERTRGAVLRFTVDGERRLPPAPGIAMGATYVSSPEREEQAAEVRFPWRPQPGQVEVSLQVEADGFLPVVRKVPVPAPGAEVVVEVALETAGAFVVRVGMPKDGRARIGAQRWLAESSTWEPMWLPMTRMGGAAHPDANGRIRFTPLARGRYRAVDTTSGAASAVVEVVPGGSVPEVLLDLARSGWVKGRVVVPDGIAPGGIAVHVDGVEAVPGAPGRAGPGGATTTTQTDGAFMVRVPGDREVVLRPDAPTLRPHATEGTARLVEPRDGIVLHLVRDDTAVVQFDRPLQGGVGVARMPGQGSTRAVCLYAGEPEGEPVLRTTARLESEGHELVFGGFEPGTYTVWIDADPFAPVVLRGRVLARGTTDLGEVSVAEGARVAFEIRVPEGRAAPRAYAWARRLGAPEYVRRVDFQGTSARLGGLGPGRWELRVGTHMRAGLHHEETLDLAEGEERRITLEAR